jgi:hypothetical protein
MRWPSGLVVGLLVVWLGAVYTVGSARGPVAQPAAMRPVLYDPDPNHLWNRVHETFHGRVAVDGTRHGLDTVDPLLWTQTKYLLSGASHSRAIALMDAFLNSNGERLISDPLKCAVFQHDLWAIFDWLAVTSGGDVVKRRALMSRVARVIRRVALTRKQIESLPDTYAGAIASGAFAAAARVSDQQMILPPDLASAGGPWVSIGGTQPIVPQHASELGRSAFIVLWSVPGGSNATFEYLKKLWEHPQPFVPDESFQFSRDGEVRVKINPALPAVLDGTRIALVRRMLLVDDRGIIVPTNVIESIQLRTFRRVQEFAEWQMSRERLFAGKSGGLRQLGADERGFTTFSAKGMDAFEGESKRIAAGAPVLRSCAICHQTEFGPAIESIRSLRGVLRPYTFVDPRHERWTRWFTQPIIAAEAKGRTYEWGVLQGLWQSHPR